jgi:hypothetical protein
MPRAAASNVPPVPLRWSPERAAPEFAISHVTIRAALAQASEPPGKDGLYSTQQLLNALHGSMAQERLATQRAVRRRVELNNAILEASVVDKATLMQGLGRIADAMVSRITASSLSRDEQNDLLRELSSIPVTLDEVAREQTRLPRAGQHADDGEDDVGDDVAAGRQTKKTHFRTRPGFKTQKA